MWIRQIWRKQFSGVLSHDPYRENKARKLKKSVNWTEYKKNTWRKNQKNEWEAPFYLIVIIYLFFPTDLDVCFSSPCQNAGTCHNAGAGQFMCLCPAIFRGITCEGNITKTFLQCLWHQRAYIFHLSLVFPLLYVRVQPPPVSERLPYATTDPKHLKFSSQSSMIKDHLSNSDYFGVLRLCNFRPWFLTSFKRPLDAWCGFLFAECTAPLRIYEEISLTAWNHTYHYLEMAYNNFSSQK